MVTSGLEKLILTGSAKYKTYSIGGSGVGTIQCPNSALYIVLVDFIWNPFADVDLAQGTNLDSLTGQLIHTMRLRNSKDTFIYNFRDSFSRGQAGSIPFFGGAGRQYDSYIVSKENLEINIFKFSPVKLASFNIDTIPLTTNEDPSPVGYGGQPAVRSVSTLNSSKISSMGLFRDPGSLAGAGGSDKNEFFDGILTPPSAAGDNKLTPPNTANNDTVFGFPLITFGIVEVNEVPDSNLR